MLAGNYFNTVPCITVTITLRDMNDLNISKKEKRLKTSVSLFSLKLKKTMFLLAVAHLPLSCHWTVYFPWLKVSTGKGKTSKSGRINLDWDQSASRALTGWRLPQILVTHKYSISQQFLSQLPDPDPQLNFWFSPDMLGPLSNSVELTDSSSCCS